MRKEEIKKILTNIIWAEMPEKLKEKSINLVLNNINNSRMLDELKIKLEKNIEFNGIQRIRNINVN